MILGGVLVYFGTRENFKPPNPSTPSGNNSFRSIILLPGFLISVLVMFGVRFSNSMANPSFPLIVKDFGISPMHLNSMTGAIMAASAVAAAFAAGILGHIGDRMGRRIVLMACCAGACIASAGHYFAASLTALFIVRVLFGFTVAGMLPAANAIIHSVVDPRSIGKAYGLATSLSMLGIAVGPALGGFLAMTTGLRTPFLFTSAAQLSLGLMVMAFFHEPGRLRKTDH
jgi:MFS family permease